MFPAVEPDEMAFAMAIFVSAGSGRMSTATGIGGFDGSACRRLFLELSAETEIIPGRQRAAPGEVSLFRAFSAVWLQFGGEGCQPSLCARVLGFHYLMERSNGVALQHLLEPAPDSSAVVLLPPAVVGCLAKTILSPAGILNEGAFLAEIDVELNSGIRYSDNAVSADSADDRVVAIMRDTMQRGARE